LKQIGKKIAALILRVVSNDYVQNKLLSFLKKQATEYLIVNILKIAGFKAWIVGLLTKEVITQADEHLIEPMFREIGYQADSLEGAIIYKKVIDASSVDDWVAELGDV